MLQLFTFALRLGVRWGLGNRLARLLGLIHSLLPNTKPNSQTLKSASVLNRQAFKMWGYSLAHGGVRREVGQKAVARRFPQRERQSRRKLRIASLRHMQPYSASYGKP